MPKAGIESVVPIRMARSWISDGRVASAASSTLTSPSDFQTPPMKPCHSIDVPSGI